MSETLDRGGRRGGGTQGGGGGEHREGGIWRGRGYREGEGCG